MGKAKHLESDIANVNAHEAADAVVDQNQDESENQEQRQLRNLINCAEDIAWHPNYSLGWAGGTCSRTLSCISQGSSTELSCCKANYPNQMSGACLASLPNPPTTSPTEAGGFSVYYPDYDTAWTQATCINERPLPSGRPTYSTLLACCKGAYGGQVSGACLASLPNPPTMSPTETGGLSVYYPDYSTAWPEATCINERPLPSGRPNYSTLLACCKGAYGGQTSGACIASLPNPPTMSPTETGGLSVYYPDYSTAWTQATCINERPLPSGRPTYSSQLACCRGAYGGQTSAACICAIDACNSCSCPGDKSGCPLLTCS